jgi:hypothetical protein
MKMRASVTEKEKRVNPHRERTDPQLADEKASPFASIESQTPRLARTSETDGSAASDGIRRQEAGTMIAGRETKRSPNAKVTVV